MAVIFAVPAAASSSWTPVTVTAWAVYQLPVVNVSAAEGTVAAAVLSETTVTVTDALGRVASRIWKSAVDPSATGRLGGSTARPAVSSSATSISTSAVCPSNSLPSGSAVAVILAVPAAASSSCSPVTMTVWAVFQFSVVNSRFNLFTDATAVSSEPMFTVTVSLGLAESFNSNMAVDPSVTGRLDLSTTSLAVSSSSTSTPTSAVAPS